MSVTEFSGPVIVSGQAQTSGTYNPDLGPSVIWGGQAFYDWRYSYKQDSNTTRSYGFYEGGNIIAIDQVPSASSTATVNIAGNQNITAATAMTLVSTSGSGITVMSAALTIPQTGNIVPSGTLCIDSLPTTITYGQNIAVGVADPTTALSRGVQIRAYTSAAGTDFTVAGYDLYGVPMTETITAAAGTSTTAGAKAFKFIASVTPTTTEAQDYGVGVSNFIGFPLRVDRFAYSRWVVNNAVMTSTTGFAAADTTSPATTTTDDVRGGYTLQTAANGTLRVQCFINIDPNNCATLTGVFGVTQA